MNRGRFLAAAVLAGPAFATAAEFRADIVRTPYGVPHVTAPDFAGLGYGTAYAYAQDNVCVLADELVTIDGERSRHFGPDAQVDVATNPIRNLEADLFFRTAFDLPALRKAFAGTTAENREMIRGWIAGYNRYLRDTPPDRRPQACANAAWVRPLTIDDVLRTTDYRARYLSSGVLARWIATAAPPGAGSKPLADAGPLLPPPDRLGSNAWAFGRDTTANGSGLLVGNPHVPWNGGIRFYEVHQTVPGRFDAMGIINAASPVITMGFNRDVAWTHTVAADRHFTFFALDLDPADPTVYLVDGKPRRMDRTTVSLVVRGKPEPEVRTLYRTVYGPVIATPISPWTTKRAYALGDSNLNNQRQDDTWLAIARARSVGDIQGAISRSLGLGWVNTVAADRTGTVLYADVTALPNVSAEKLRACAPAGPLPPQFVTGGFPTLDGSRSECAWDLAKGTPQPGLLPRAAMPVLQRADWVANSNDSYWLANPAAKFPPLSPILGRTDVEQGLRTRAGLSAITERLAGSDGLAGRQVDPASAKAMMYGDQSFAARLVLDDLLTACRGRADLAAACEVLARWDRRAGVDSRGVALFAEFWRRAAPIPGLWRTPFDVADPVGTPRGLATDGPAGPRILDALAAAAAELKGRGIALDARWGDVQFVPAAGQRIPIPGAPSQLGVLNAIESRFSASAGGYVPFAGSTFSQVTTFDARGPVADAVVSYSQSADPASPHATDQTQLFSRKAWVRLPFRKEDVAAQAVGPAMHIEE